MDRLIALVGELEAMQERLRAGVVIQEGEPITLEYEGRTYTGKTPDTVYTRNPDGPAAADAIGKAIATLKAQREALEPFARVRASTHARDDDFMEVLRRVSAEEQAERIAAGHPPLGQSPKEMCSLDGLTVADFRRARASIEGNPTA